MNSKFRIKKKQMCLAQKWLNKDFRIYLGLFVVYSPIPSAFEIVQRRMAECLVNGNFERVKPSWPDLSSCYEDRRRVRVGGGFNSTRRGSLKIINIVVIINNYWR